MRTYAEPGDPARHAYIHAKVGWWAGSTSAWVRSTFLIWQVGWLNISVDREAQRALRARARAGNGLEPEDLNTDGIDPKYAPDTHLPTMAGKRATTHIFLMWSGGATCTCTTAQSPTTTTRLP